MFFSLENVAGCDNTATNALFSTLYFELHRLAKRELARQWGPLSLSVTTLLHEAYLDMAGRGDLSFPDHARFIGYAARVMRGLVIDHARNRIRAVRGRIGKKRDDIALILGGQARHVRISFSRKLISI